MSGRIGLLPLARQATRSHITSARYLKPAGDNLDLESSVCRPIRCHATPTRGDIRRPLRSRNSHEKDAIVTSTGRSPNPNRNSAVWTRIGRRRSRTGLFVQWEEKLENKLAEREQHKQQKLAYTYMLCMEVAYTCACICLCILG